MSQAKRDWSSFDYKSYKLVTSPSAMETASDCNRKWWFLKVIRLKEPQKHFTKLGDVFHEVCERWLEADDNGRDAAGQEVNVFPNGWADVLDFGQEAVVRAIFKAFVDEGILRRTPGRKVEKSFQVPVIPGASIMGFADVWTPLGIEDHKTSKSRRYLETRSGLAENIQMMTYAAAWCMEHESAAGLELRHNQGITDPEDLYVRPTTKDVTLSQVETFWKETITPLVKRMLYWKQAGLPAESWAKVDGPKKKGICRKYGGCPFVGICGRTENIEDYKARVALHNQQFEASQAQESIMSEELLAKLAARKKARASAGVNPTVAAQRDEANAPPEDTTEPVSVVAEVTTEELRVSAPWAQADCKACEGDGISSKGEACRPCTIKAKKLGILATDFKLKAGEGTIVISRADVIVAQVPFTVEVVKADNTKPEPQAAAPAAAPAATPASAPAAAPAAASASASASTAEVDKGKGRPKKGFTLLYGVVKRGKGKFIDLQLVMQERGAQLAEEWNAGSFWAIDAFKRREALAHKAEEIAEGFGPNIVMVTSDQRDLVDFASALEPFASTVFVAGVR